MNTLPLLVGEVEVQVPARWVICSQCDGEGKSSAYLGAYTAEEFHEAFSDDDQQAYFRGEYDRTCECCRGRGSILEPDESVMSGAQREALRIEREVDADERACLRAEQRLMGDY